MIKGEKVQHITWDDVCKHTNNGYDVFRSEVGEFSPYKPFKSPLREDKNPSFGITCINGMWFYKDLASGESGTALQFVQKRYNLSYAQAVRKMAEDFGLVIGRKEYKPVKVDWIAPVIDEEEQTLITFDSKKWQSEHIAFWENTGVTESLCRRYDTYALSGCAVNRKHIRLQKGEVAFAYYASDIGRTKLYFPERQKGKRFKNNVPNSYLWNLNRIKKCDKLLVQKSMKDLLVTAVLTECVIATQNESAMLLLEHNYDILEPLADRKLICFGSDPQGWHESFLITYLTGWNYINTPNSLLPDINDTYAMAKKFGIKEVETLLKAKEVI